MHPERSHRWVLDAHSIGDAAISDVHDTYIEWMDKTMREYTIKIRLAVAVSDQVLAERLMDCEIQYEGRRFIPIAVWHESHYGYMPTVEAISKFNDKL